MFYEQSSQKEGEREREKVTLSGVCVCVHVGILDTSLYANVFYVYL